MNGAKWIVLAAGAGVLVAGCGGGSTEANSTAMGLASNSPSASATAIRGCTQTDGRLDCHNAQLAYEDLQNQDLRKANFDGANLSHAKLRSAKLDGASLLGADLSEADLSFTNLTQAKLDGANLQDAHFRKTVIVDASLVGADMRGVAYSWSSAEGNGGEIGWGSGLAEGADLSGAQMSPRSSVHRNPSESASSRRPERATAHPRAARNSAPLVLARAGCPARTLSRLHGVGVEQLAVQGEA